MTIESIDHLDIGRDASANRRGALRIGTFALSILIMLTVCTAHLGTISAGAPHARHSVVAASRTSGLAPRTRKRTKTIFIIMMENHSWSQIYRSSSAPYINSRLLRVSSFATRYLNPPGNHPSLPNYLWLEGGQCYAYCGTDNPPSIKPNGITTSNHLVSRLSKAGISWKAYEEGATDGRCPLRNHGQYAPKHDPFVYFNDVNGSRVCSTHVRSFSDLTLDLRHNSTGRYNFITPNLCHDMHDDCSPTNDAVKQGDSWLSVTVPRIVQSSAYRQGGVLFVTWDEAEGGDGPIGMIVTSAYGKGRGYHNSIAYTHSSTLRTVEEIFGLAPPYLGDANHARDLRDLFTAFP